MDRKREMRLPIYIEAAMGVFLVVILAMAGRNGMIPQNQKNNVMKQSESDFCSTSDCFITLFLRTRKIML